MEAMFKPPSSQTLNTPSAPADATWMGSEQSDKYRPEAFQYTADISHAERRRSMGSVGSQSPIVRKDVSFVVTYEQTSDLRI